MQAWFWKNVTSLTKSSVHSIRQQRWASLMTIALMRRRMKIKRSKRREQKEYSRRKEKEEETEQGEKEENVGNSPKALHQCECSPRDPAKPWEEKSVWKETSADQHYLTFTASMYCSLIALSLSLYVHYYHPKYYYHYQYCYYNNSHLHCFYILLVDCVIIM